MAEINQLSPGLWHISLPFQGEQGVVGAYVLTGQNAEGQTDLVLIDPGPETTAQALLTALQRGGWDPAQVTHILITHIHLDHSGGVGTLLHSMPRANVFVHALGAPHLSDPARLIQSAARIYGERMQILWGKIEPVPADHIQVINDGTRLPIAGRELQVYHTPGHASHHVIFYDHDTRELFAGDVAGVRLEGVDYVRPPTPPPDVDLEGWSRSIDLITSLQPEVLYLAHFGAEKESTHLLEELRLRLFEWGELVLHGLRDHKDEATIIADLIGHVEPELQQRAGGDPDVSIRYDLTTNYKMTVQGYIRYWQKQHPERLV